MNLGIFNLLPIPILDGGVILFLLIEGLMRRDISMNIKERVYQAAFVFLVLFAVMVIFNDLTKTIPVWQIDCPSPHLQRARHVSEGQPIGSFAAFGVFGGLPRTTLRKRPDQPFVRLQNLMLANNLANPL